MYQGQVRYHGIGVIALIALTFGSATPTVASSVVKANNADNLNLGSSWLGGAAPGGADTAVFDSTVTGASAAILGDDLSWEGIQVLGLGGAFTVNVGDTLTLGARGIDMSSASQNLTLNCAIYVSADQTWNSGTKQASPWGPVDMAGHQVTTAGTKVQFKNTVTGGGTLVAGSPQTQLSAGTTASSTVGIAPSGGALVFDTASGVAALPRMQSVTVAGGTLSVSGNSSSHSVDTITGALTVDGTGSTTSGDIVSVAPNAAKNAQLVASSLVRTRNAVALFRGTNLGAASIATPTANIANIGFGSAPTAQLVGGNGGAGTTTISILPWAYGDSTAAGNGAGLVTYDLANGIRPLNTSTEYTPGFADGENASKNVRLAAFTNTLNGAATINGLVMAAGSLINGTGTLTVASGTILAASAATIGTTNAPGVLNFGSAEGVVAGAYGLTIAESITGSGGLTKGGTGTLTLGGGRSDTAVNTYSGTTTLTSGFVTLSKANSVTAIPGDVVINGGSLLQSGISGQINTNCTLTINNGSYSIAGNSTQQGVSETLANVSLLGSTASASVGAGSYGGSSVTVWGNTVVSNGALRAAGKGAWWRTTGLTLWGSEGRTNLAVATTDNNGDAGLNVGVNGMTIHQPASGASGVLSLTCNTSGRNANWQLYGDLAYNGNAANTNAATASIAGAYPHNCVLSMNATRTFTVNPGGGPVDLILAPRVAGAGYGLNKAGSGVLVLTYTNNTYTGPTTINAGTLLVNGALAAGSAVTNYATLGGTGLVSGAVTTLGGTLAPGYLSVGQLTLANNVTFTNAGSRYATLQIELAGTAPGTGYDQLVLTSPTAKVVLFNVTLALSRVNGFAPDDGSMFTILDNQGSSPIQGTFAGLPQNGTLAVGDRSFRITYVGGTGNDVVLTSMRGGSLIMVR